MTDVKALKELKAKVEARAALVKSLVPNVLCDLPEIFTPEQADVLSSLFEGVLGATIEHDRNVATILSALIAEREG